MATDLPSKKAQRARFNVGQLCWYCKRPMSPPRATRPGDRPGTEATLDHVVTRGRKGDDHPENILLACARCYNLRGDVPYEVFRSFAQLVVVPYADAPTPFLRVAMREFIYRLAEGGVHKRESVNSACRFGLLALANCLQKE